MSNNILNQFEGFRAQGKWIGPKELEKKSLMGAAVMIAMLAGLVVDITGIVLAGISYTRLTKWSQNTAIVVLPSTASLQGFQSMAMTTIFFLAMMICLGADILLTMFLGDRRLQQGAARTYAVVVVFQVPIAVANITLQMSAQTKAFFLQICDVTMAYPDCTGWWTSIAVATIVPQVISAAVHLLAAAFILHFSQIEAKRPAVLPHTHPLPKPKTKHSKSRKGSSLIDEKLTTAPQSRPQSSTLRTPKPLQQDPSMFPDGEGYGTAGDIMSSDSDDVQNTRPARSTMSTVTGPPTGYSQVGSVASAPATSIPVAELGSRRRSRSTSKPPQERSAKYNSLPKTRPSHGRTESSLQKFNDELDESEDEIDRLVSPDRAVQEGRMVGAGGLRQSSSSDNSESSDGELVSRGRSAV